MFQSVDRAGRLTGRPLGRRAVLAMIKRRAATAGGLPASTCCHTFRAKGITAYLSNGGTLEHAQQIAGHASPKTTKPSSSERGVAPRSMRCSSGTGPGCGAGRGAACRCGCAARSIRAMWSRTRCSTRSRNSAGSSRSKPACCEPTSEQPACDRGSVYVETEVPKLLAGKYRLARRLGCGGMGAVYLARDLRLSSAMWRSRP